MVGKSYIDQMFKPSSKADFCLLADVMKEFHLNIEQERAFRIIANHAVTSDPEKLYMFLGRVGGTGKSQVIKAMMVIFDRRKESHRFIVVAPTGTATSLLNGSTYHSLL